MDQYHLQNLDCANCAANLEAALKKTPGVRFASVNFATTTLFLETDDFPAARQTIQNIEPGIRLQAKAERKNEPIFPLRQRLFPIALAALLFASGLLSLSALQQTPSSWGLWLVFGSAYLISGWGVLASAARNITRGKVFDEHFLMSVATLGAVAIGELPEAVGVMLFYQAGELVQDLAVHRSRRSIQALLAVRPEQANLLEGGEIRLVKPDTVAVGAQIIVRPGEKVPLDGEVINGDSFLDTSPLTGEATPRRVAPGSQVLAGSINQNGLLTLKVNRPFEQSSITRILTLVEGASARKAAPEKFITRFARVYSPLVVGITLGVALLPPLLTGDSFADWLYRALVVLVISCPCALVISIPLGYFGGVGGAARRGILVKGSNYLDALATVRTVVFDKTGTLTQGVFRVSQVLPRNGFGQAELLNWAAHAEAGSNHPIAHSIRAAAGVEVLSPLDSFQEMAGFGVAASLQGRELLAGNDGLLHRENIAHDGDACQANGTVVHVAVDGTHAGSLVIADALKPDAPAAIAALRAVGVDQIWMLTGDSPEVAGQVAGALQLDGYRAGLLPEEKVSALESLLVERSPRGRLAFVGDGINDAPALARADVGIAMGALGSQAAIETADVVLMTESPAKVAEAIQVARRTRSIVWQNIALALAIKGLFIGLGILGIANMWMAVFGDMGVALLAVLNATRVLKGAALPGSATQG